MTLLSFAPGPALTVLRCFGENSEHNVPGEQLFQRKRRGSSHIQDGPKVNLFELSSLFRELAQVLVPIYLPETRRQSVLHGGFGEDS